ncbi:MAG: NAD-dependent aldehyde dehydrogenase [Segetibacter sp.]|nr:NAD-dependent aldehyde dehydrogenase [Segetibacter sp.]
MEQSQATITILNDLIEINNDRIAGYERAIEELQQKDYDLKIIFAAMIDQSRQAKIALGKEVQVLGGDMNTGTTNSGKIYRAWMDVKAVFTGHDRLAVLSNCEFGEDAAQKAYATALAEEHFPAFLKTMIAGQKATFKSSHDEIKALRDQEKKIKEEGVTGGPGDV